MKPDMLMLKCVQALEKGLIPSSRGWDEEKAQALYDAMAIRPKLALPSDVTSDMVYETIQGILLQMEEAESKYVPRWAKPLLS